MEISKLYKSGFFFSFWEAGSETFTCIWLVIDCTKIDHALKIGPRRVNFLGFLFFVFGREISTANHFDPINGCLFFFL